MIINSATYDALSIGTVVALDFETTGFDPDKDEILEVGMVRMERGEIVARYSQLFNPSVSIPKVVTKLTGIKPEDCSNKPLLKEKLPEITEFLKNSWVVAHNADFDLAFLKKAFQQFTSDPFPISPERVLDTLELSQFLLPMLPNHRLETVADFLNIASKPEHRALCDAEATVLIFRDFIPMILSLDIQVIKLVNRILTDGFDGLSFFFERVAAFVGKYNSGGAILQKKGPPNILGKPVSSYAASKVRSFNEKEIDIFFEPGGLLSKIMPRYESRKPQQEMARLVGRTFHQDGFLVAEAGTGVGKSLAYLIPAVLWIMQGKDRRVIISTHTKTLQDQLFTKELPMLSDTLELPFIAVLLKGRANYICLERWENLVTHIEEKFSPEKRKKLLPLVLWLFGTQTGDIEENTGFSWKKNRDIWSQLNCEAGYCSGAQCKYESVCFFQKVRQASRSANIVVVNHSLLFSDAASGYPVLSDYDTLIIDEAHQVERVASQCLGSSLHLWLFRDLSQQLYYSEVNEGGVLAAAGKLLKKVLKDKVERKEAEQLLRNLKELSLKLPQAALRFFRALEVFVSLKVPQKGFFQKLRIRESRMLFGPLSLETEALKELLNNLYSDLSRFLSLFSEEESDILGIKEVQQQLEFVLENLVHHRELLNHFLKEDYGEEVVWCELVQKQNEREAYLYSVPLNIADILSEKLYSRLKRCVMTSATLTVGGKFDYILSRLGIDHVEPDRVITRVFGSPFDFREQALFLIPTFVPSPKDQNFSTDISELLEHILAMHPKGTMALFTSHKMLREVYYKIQPTLEEMGIHLLGQGIDGSRTSLLKIFQEDEKSVLLGTNSFWEGIDVPGSALELLVITKIPFDVPTEPLIEARMEQVGAKTGNGFFNYAVPEAIVRFRQGFGRLIRSGEDRGIILLLDRRVVQTQYGELLLESLPVEPNICREEKSLMKILEEWFG